MHTYFDHLFSLLHRVEDVFWLDVVVRFAQIGKAHNDRQNLNTHEHMSNQPTTQTPISMLAIYNI